jgi:hypothetical protein
LGKQLERERQCIISEAARTAPSGSFTVLPLLLARRQEYAVADLNFIEAVKSAYDQWVAAQRPAAMPDHGHAAIPRGKAPRRRAEPIVPSQAHESSISS